MKKFLSFVLMVTILGLPMQAMATADARGAAIIPPYYGYLDGGGSFLGPYVNISNITNSTVTVKITLYKQDGTILYDASTNATQGYFGSRYTNNFTEANSDFTATFDIDANETVQVFWPNVGTTLDTVGYGKIEWTIASSKLPVALIAGGFVASTSGESRYSFVVNNGLPF